MLNPSFSFFKFVLVVLQKWAIREAEMEVIFELREVSAGLAVVFSGLEENGNEMKELKIQTQ